MQVHKFSTDIYTHSSVVVKHSPIYVTVTRLLPVSFIFSLLIEIISDIHTLFVLDWCSVISLLLKPYNYLCQNIFKL